jgi:hypothetical protein
MDAIDGMRVFIRALLGFGIKPEEVKLMLKDNPAKLMWLDELQAIGTGSRGAACCAQFDHNEHVGHKEGDGTTVTFFF